MIHTIDIDNVKRIMNNCHYYDYITNYDIDYSDEVTTELIDWYKDVIFLYNSRNKSDLEIVNKLDRSIYFYLKDNKYRRGLKRILDIDDFDIRKRENLIDKINYFTDDYEKNIYLYINSSKWI